jgi:DNA/RNA endonuclease YhcR with UshA esterase domain
MRYAALLVALVGIVCLHLMAMYREVPGTTIGQITPTMNYAYKSVTGRALQAPRFYEENGRLTGVQLTLADESGELRVRGFKPVAEALRARGVVIRKGDKVKVAGTLRVIEDNVSMMLQTPEHLEVLESAAPLAVALNELGGVDEGKLVTVRGVISRVEMPRSERAPYNITLSDGTGDGRVVAWRNVVEAIADEAALQRGATIEIRANVSKFRGEPQLQLEDARDVQVVAAATQTDVPAAEPAVRAMALSELGSDQVGQRVQIKAVIRDVRAPREGTRAPYMVTLDDQGTQMTMVLWSDTYGQLPNAAALRAGTPVQATVEVSEYRGRLQLALKGAADMTLGAAAGEAAATPAAPVAARKSAAPAAAPKPAVRTAAPAATPAAIVAVLTPAAAIALEDGAQTVISGVVRNVRLAQAGTRAPHYLYLAGAGADVPLVCWADTYEAIPTDQRPGQNSVIKATVTVASFKGAKQLKLMNAGDYALLTRGLISTPAGAEATAAGKSAAPTGGGDMSVRAALQADVNTSVRVKAKVKSIVPPASDRAPYRIVLEDGGKEITVIIWADAYGQILPDQRPEPGKTVRADGIIVEYKGENQIRVRNATQLRPAD